MDEVLYQIGAYAVLEGTQYYVRSDVGGVSWLKRPGSGRQRNDLCGPAMADKPQRHTLDCTDPGGAIEELPTIASITVYGGGTATMGAQSYDFYLDFGCNFQPYGSPIYNGPIYQIKPPALSCLQTALDTVGDQIRSIAEALVGGIAVSCIRVGCQTALLNSARGVLAGTVSLDGFADVFLAVVSAADIPAILAAAGVSVGVDMLYQYIKCMANGG